MKIGIFDLFCILVYVLLIYGSGFVWCNDVKLLRWSAFFGWLTALILLIKVLGYV